MENISPYIFAFSRCAIGLVFLISFLGKIRDMRSFQSAISNFKLLPHWLERPAALGFMTGELVVVVLLILGGSWARYGLLIALLMLVAFSVALGAVLARGIQTSCNCFGPNQQNISFYEIVRNSGFIGCTFAGWWTGDTSITPNFAEWSLVGTCALLFVLISLSFRDVLEFLFTTK